MITTFAIDDNNDITLGADGNVAIFKGVRAIEALCDAAAQTLLGEMVLQVDQGLPNFQVVWKPGQPNVAQFQAALRIALQNIEGVIGVPEIKTSTTDGTLAYTAKINNIYGTVTINGSV